MLVRVYGGFSRSGELIRLPALFMTSPKMDLKGRVLEAAEAEAIRVFGLNLKALLLAAPAGRLPTLAQV